MDLSDLVNIAAQISIVETQFESSSTVLQNSEELNKHCMDLIREKPAAQGSSMTTVQFLANCGIRSDKLRETTHESAKTIGSAKSVPPRSFVQSMTFTETPGSSSAKNVWASTNLGDLSNFIRICHDDFLNATLYDRSLASECVSISEYTRIVTDECGQLSEASMNGRLFPAGKAMRTELQNVVKFYYELVSHVKPARTSSFFPANQPVDFLQYVPYQMPSTHPNSKAVSMLWRTLKAVLPPPQTGTVKPKWDLISLASKGMTFLQGKIANVIRSTVDGNLSRARVSLAAGFDIKVEGFLKIIGRGFDTWGKMYYLILSGEYKLALSLITNKEGVVERALSDFCSNKTIS